MSRRVVVGLCVSVLILGVSLVPSSAGTITLDQLISGASLQVGDKIFADWWYQALANPGTGGVQLPSPTGVLIDYGVLPNNDISLKYQMAVSAWGGGTGDVLWGYTISTVSGAPLIHDWSMSLLAFGTSGGPLNSVIWSETLYGSPQYKNLITSAAVSHVKPWNTFSEVLDQPYSKIWVIKDLAVYSTENGTAHVSLLEQRWSQVPEASSFALFGLGFVGLGLFRRFRKR
jgi:hypothetical protein